MNRIIKQVGIMILLCWCMAGCDGDIQSTDTAVSKVVQTSDSSSEDVKMNWYGAAEDNVTGESEKEQTEDKDFTLDTLEVHYIDVGQGDSVLIKQGSHAMLIDAGNNDKGTTVWSYLLNQKTKSLDYAIGTHPDADHIGGMDVVLYKLDCHLVLLPDCENDTRTYEDLMDTIQQREQEVTVPKKGECYQLGKAQFQVLTDTEKDYEENINDCSIAIRLTFGGTSFLFTGDAEEEAEQDMMRSGLILKSDVYKVAHHGANFANTVEFLTVVNPSYAVISCGEGNSYGHPRAEVLNNLYGLGIKVFRTDEQGTIVATSDGEQITFNCSPSVTWKAGEPTGGKGNILVQKDADSTKEQDIDGMWKYVLNIHSMKIHYPDCSSVDNMSEKNKEYTNLSKETLIKQGYEPCKNCKP